MQSGVYYFPHFRRGILEQERGIIYTYFARLPFALYASVAKGFLQKIAMKGNRAKNCTFYLKNSIEIFNHD